MQNILKLQDALKNLSDQQLAQEMQSPSGRIPQFLIMTEMNRRNEMRNEAKKAPEGTVADELVQQAMQPQGIMNLPDETLAGAAMRARISGEQQQAPGGMVAMPPGQAPQQAPQQAMPPQGMAGGGSVQFGNIFGDMANNAGTQASGTPDLIKQNYMPTNGYVAPKTDDYSNFRHQFDGRPTPHTPNPRVHSSPYAGLDLPKGIAMPTEGTAGLVRNMSNSMRNPQFTGYSWASPAYRDAYIRYMTPPAATTQSTPVTSSNMAGGGPAHFDGTERSDVTLEEDPVVIPGMPFSESWPYFMSGSPMGAFAIPGQQPITGAGINALRQTGALGPVRRSEVDDRIAASEGSIYQPPKPKTETPEASTSSSTPSSSPVSGPAPTGILSGLKSDFLEGLSSKYAGMTQPAVQRQPIPQVSAYAFEPSKTQEAPQEKLRDYAGETKAEINKLLEGLSGDSEALKQRDRDMALAQAGFAIAASKNPYALGAIGEGAQAGMADYIKNRKEARALDAERIKAQIAAAASAGEMGQRQGLGEAEMGQRERISNRELGSKESIAKLQLAQSAEIANIEALLKADTNAIARERNNLPPDSVRELEYLGGGDPIKGIVLKRADDLLAGFGATLKSGYASPDQIRAAEQGIARVQELLGLGVPASKTGKTVINTGRDRENRKVEMYSDGTIAVVEG